jgi:hypothetical protein
VVRRLRSATSPTFLQPSTRRRTIGDRAFSLAASREWNLLPADIRDCQCLLTFRRKLKNFLFISSFPDI